MQTDAPDQSHEIITYRVFLRGGLCHDLIAVVPTGQDEATATWHSLGPVTSIQVVHRERRSA